MKAVTIKPVTRLNACWSSVVIRKSQTGTSEHSQQLPQVKVSELSKRRAAHSYTTTRPTRGES